MNLFEQAKQTKQTVEGWQLWMQDAGYFAGMNKVIKNPVALIAATTDYNQDDEKKTTLV